MPAQAWVTMIVGSVAAFGVIVTWQQKNGADRRSEWWRRVTWSLERTFSEADDEIEIGWTMLDTLVTSRLVTVDERRLVQIISVYIAESESEPEGTEDDRYR